jgi:HK97 family phage portal protein
MGIFASWFSKKNINTNKKANLLTLQIPNFTNINDIRENDVFMSAVLCNARHTSKVNVRAYRKDDVLENDLTFLLNRRPNRLMSASTFWEKARINYDCDTNVFIYLDWESISTTSKKLNSLWIIDPCGINVLTDENKNIWFSFFLDGKQIYCDESQLAIVSKNINKNEMFGSGNSCIKKAISVIDTNYQGIENAIKTSAYIRFILQTATLMTDEKKKDKAKSFSEAMLNAEVNNTGVAVIDGAEKLTQIDNKGDYVHFEEIKTFQDNIYKFLGVNEKILRAESNDNEWQAYYESTLEPFFVKLSDELTYKIFNSREIGFGNEIRAETNRIQNASYDTRLKIAERIQLLPKYAPNLVLKLLYLPEIEGGDDLYENKNYQQALDNSIIKKQGEEENGTKQNDKK